MHFIRTLSSATLIVLVLVSPQSSEAVLYVNDAETRRAATPEEEQSFLFMRSTAFLVADDIIVTTKHTRTDGAFPISENQFVIVSEILEESREALGDVDYKIARIEWREMRDVPRRGLYPIECPKGRLLFNRISPVENQYYARIPKSEQPLDFPFVVFGYPRNSGLATTSNGSQLVFEPMGTEPGATRVLFNAGVVQGSSGGPILDLEGRLIGLVTGGPGYSEKPEHDPANPAHFNWGLSAQSLYGISPMFKKIVDEAAASGRTSCQ